MPPASTSRRGSIQSKVFLLLGLAALVFFGGGAFAINRIIVPVFEEIERRTAAEETFRVQRAIEEDTASLYRFLNDWASRDDIRWFVREGRADSIPAGLDIAPFERLGVDIIAFVKTDGSILYAREHNQNSPIPAPAWFVEATRAIPANAYGAKGFLIGDDGMPALAAFRSVSALDNSGTAGVIGMAQFMDSDYEFSLFRRLRTRLMLEPNTVGHAAPPSTDVGETHIRARLPFYDVFLNRGLTVVVDVPRQFVPTMTQALSHMNIFMSAMAILMAAGLWFVLSREILVPIRQITRRIRLFGRGDGLRVGSTGGTLDDLPVSRRDEVGEIAAEIAFLHDRIVDLANRDPLTGISTRRPFQDRLSHALERAARYGHSVAILFIDLDEFKPINDTYGHAAGDAVLKAVAHRLAQTLRKSDSLARVGGDEFAILLETPVNRASAAIVIDKVRDSIRHPIVFENHQLEVGASIGLAVYPEDGQDLETLIAAADKAMYASKPKRQENRGPSPSLIVAAQAKS